MADDERDIHPEDQTDEHGAQGGSGGSADSLPAAPDSDDDTALGDTDQLSDAQA